VIWWLSWLIWLGIYPLTSEGFGVRKPWVVRGIALLTIGVSLWYMVAFLYNDNPDPDLARLMLWGGDPQALHALVADEIAALRDEGWTGAEIQAELATLPSYEPRQLLTHVLLHADPLHLAGNMLFLIVLGARVNALIGNALTLV